MGETVGSALIVGAAGHLGRRITESMFQQSFTLAINDIDEKESALLAASMEGAASFAGDVSESVTASQLVADVVDQFGPIDVLVNALGIEGPIAAIEDIQPQDLRHVFDVNVLSLFWLCRAVVPTMKQNGGGRIINLASGAGLAGGAFASPYHASKHAVVGLTRSLARELAPHQIAVNAVCPGYVESPMVDRIIDGQMGVTGSEPDVLESIPMGRMADAEEVASVVTFLALDAPLYMTGSCLSVDGGLRA
jgi:NAD(P)-dependent dehydrogenase (short-subunit alcohol dehydrogenase family)